MRFTINCKKGLILISFVVIKVRKQYISCFVGHP